MNNEKQPKKELIHDLSSLKKRNSSPLVKQLLFTVVIMLILGIGTGYIASNVSGGGGPGKVTSGVPEDGEVKKGTTAGVSNTKDYPENAEGVLKEGGFEGEGEFHLIRPGGESQTAYLYSPVVDLSQFVGKTVKVWGKSQKPQKVGWLMEVGKVEVK